VVDNAKINAIEILPGVSGPSLVLNFKYPDGTPVAGTLAYNRKFLPWCRSRVLSHSTMARRSCVIFANPSAMGISAQFQVALSLADTAGHVIWQFSIGNEPGASNLGAVQSSALNVVVQKCSFSQSG